MDNDQVQDSRDYQACLFVSANKKVTGNYIDKESADFEPCTASLEDYNFYYKTGKGILNVLHIQQNTITVWILSYLD